MFFDQPVKISDRNVLNTTMMIFSRTTRNLTSLPRKTTEP